MTVLKDERRRRAAFRAGHRGTKELDWLVGRYADNRLPSMSEAELAAFEQLLGVPDPDVQSWLLAPTPHVGEFEALIADIRRFHGLDSKDQSP